MMLKQKIFIIIVAVLFLSSLGFNLLRLAPEGKNYDNYTIALQKYNRKSFSEAYYLFGKVSRFSKLKPAAIYRQAICAERLEDFKAEENRYKQIIRNYPNSSLAIRARYLKAQMAYDSKNYTKAQNDFKNILTKHPKTDYALAAQYYLGAIEITKLTKTRNQRKKEKIKKTAIKFFKTYLKEAPNGKFAMNCIQKWLALDPKLNNEDNLLIAMVYQENQNFKSADKYLKFTNLSVAWPYFVKNAYETKNMSKVKYYTEQGLKGKGEDEISINEVVDDKKENENVYKAIDLYLKTSNDPKTSISYLLSISGGSKGQDYLLYKNCNNLPEYQQTACFNTLFYKYPDGQFAAESLTNIFLNKVKTQKYFMANKLGRQHLNKFKNVKSSPKVLFWLAKVAERTKNYDDARSYYKQLLRQYPDDYYAYHAFLNLNRFRYFNVSELSPKPVKFPYKDSNNDLIMELLKVKDYGLINQLYNEDDFIKSWLLYQQGSYSASAKEARDAMDKLEVKPERTDLRWRLVYPIHYLEEIKQNSAASKNDSTLMLSIIREESYFNPQAKSSVGARGLMQLMPATANETANRAGVSLLNTDLLFDPNINIKLGNIYYSNLKKMLSGKDVLAVLAYNGGVGSVSRWRNSINYYDVDDFIEQIPYPETQNYLRKVYRSYWNYLRVYDGIKF